MDKHKEKALEKDCRCTGCDMRFQCFTQERVFSDPVWQSLFEALMALGNSREEAIGAVANELKRPTQQLDITPFGGDADDSVVTPYVSIPYVSYPGTFDPNWKITYGDGVYSGNVSKGFDNVITYTMCDGKEVSWVTDGILE